MSATTLLQPVENPKTTWVLPIPPPFSLEQTLDCGQAFRWERDVDKGFHGVAGKYFRHFSQLDNEIFLGQDLSQEEFQFWLNYFDAERDYAPLLALFSCDPVLKKAITFAPGIRVLRQDPWEALCSFIISQNNHIPRIKGIITRFCENFGQPMENGQYTFPCAKAVAHLEPDDLAPLRAGFRARYLIDGARKVDSGQIELSALSTMPLEEARSNLRQIIGVGTKVAECTLLYGCGRVECFPVDVWIKRAMEQMYPQGLPTEFLPWAGIAQQFLFHYIRFGISSEKS